MRVRRWTTLLFSAALVVAAPAVAEAAPGARPGAVELLVSGLDGSFGSTVGPDGALYVTETAAGRITRIDPRTGATSTFADCLPPQVIALGGATDVAFRGPTAYALVTLVDAAVGGTHVSGIYRIDGRHRCTVVADIGAWSVAHPPTTDFFVPSGLQFAFQPWQKGFLVTDGHHNRVLYVTVRGAIRQLLQLPNVVPTGLSIVGDTLYLAEAGPVPHLPRDGRLVAFDLPSPTRPGTVVAAGGPLLVNVQSAYRHRLLALAQGVFGGGDPGSPALPNTGRLLRVDGHGGFDVITRGLDRPTSLEVIGDDAFVVSLAGSVWRIDDVSGN